MEAANTVAQPNAPKRRLAENVVCMFPEDRPRIAQQGRAGRNPRAVVSLRAWQRLNVGDLARIVTGKNSGKRVRIVECENGALWTYGEPFGVESLDGLLWTGGRDGLPLAQKTEAIIGSAWLRKLSSGVRK